MIAPICITFLLNLFRPDHPEIEQNEPWNNLPPLPIKEDLHDTIDILRKPGVIFTQPFTKVKHLTDSKLNAENTAPSNPGAKEKTT